LADLGDRPGRALDGAAPDGVREDGRVITPTIRIEGQRSRTASAIEPPIRPRPAMAMW